MRQAQKNALNLKEELDYHPNIPTNDMKRAKDSYVSVHGHTSLIDPCKRTLLLRNKKTEEVDGHVKYTAGIEESTSINVFLRNNAFSEKSSDSGISSSSLSSSANQFGFGAKANTAK